MVKGSGGMRQRFLGIALAVAVVGGVGWCASALAAQTPEGPSRQVIEEIIREYIQSHPEIIEDALRTLQVRRREAEQQRARDAVQANRDKLLGDASSPAGGNPQGDVTVVEFFDYRCGYCKRVAPTVKKLLEDDPNVRVVYKDFPIIGPDSALAARAALAAQVQGKYVVLHEALMAADGPFTMPAILELAQKAGLDTARLQADMETPEIRASLERNHTLAQALGIQGTPAFVIGAELVPGAVDLNTLKAFVSRARAKP
jgi:protein-disulfide isomerase